MNNFDVEFQDELFSISPNLMFGHVSLSPVNSSLSDPLSLEEEPLKLTPISRELITKFVFSDHSYAKPFPVYKTKHDNLVVPTKILQLFRKQRTVQKTDLSSDGEIEIDIETVEKPPEPLIRYNVNKASNIMNEVETYLNSLWKDVEKDDEEKFTRGNWSREQAKFFDAAYKLINNYQLAKLAYAENPNEPVLRKLSLDKATKRMRKIFGASFWNSKLIVWLHGVMIDGMGSSLFLCYLEIIQSLKRLVPALVERTLLFDKAANEKEQTAGLPNLGSKLKKTWEPSVGLNTKLIIEKFPSTPFLIIVPSGPSIPQQSTKRNRFWNHQLLNFGKPFPINVPAYRTPDGYVIKHYLEHCISATRAKIKEFRSRFPGRNVVLVGWGNGSIVSFKVALLEQIDAIICLGFPVNGLGEQPAEEYWDAFSKVECPVLFFIGLNALSNSKEKTEKFRSKLKTQSNLVLVENADEMLRLPKSQKKMLGMSQNMVDKLIQDEMYLFLKDVLFRQKIIRNHSKNLSPSKKRKKKMEAGDSVKRKKNIFSKLPNSMAGKSTLPPLGLQIQASVETSRCVISQGLLTTTSVPSFSPVISRLSSGTLTTRTQTPPKTSNLSIKTNVEFKKTGQKRGLSRDKDCPKKAKNAKNAPHTNKLLGNFLGHQKYTASLGNQKSGNLTGQRFSSGNYRFQQSKQQQRPLPSRSFVLSGSTGHVRFQGGTNYLYLKQSTSGGTMQAAPFLTATCGAFTAVLPTPVVNSNSTAKSSATINTPASYSIEQPRQIVDSRLMNEGRQPTSLRYSTLVNENPIDCNVYKPMVPSSSQVTPSILNSNNILDTESILNQVTDIRQLAHFISKYSKSIPNSPTTFTSCSNENVQNKTYLSSPSATSLNEYNIVVGTESETNKQDKRISILTTSDGVKKISYSPSLSQKLGIVQNRDLMPNLKSPRLKTSKGNHTMVTINKPTSSTQKGVPKNPFALNIPIANLTGGGSSKTLSVPAFSKYLSQHKIILSSARANLPTHNRAVTLHSSITSNILSSPSLFLTNKIRHQNNAKHQKSGFEKNQSPKISSQDYQEHTSFALNVPSQAFLASPVDLQKAAGDVKLIDVLNRHTSQTSKSENSLSLKNHDDELIQPRNHVPNDVPKHSLLNPLAEHMFSALKIPVELERSQIGKSELETDCGVEPIDFGIASTSQASVPKELMSGNEANATISNDTSQSIVMRSKPQVPSLSESIRFQPLPSSSSNKASKSSAVLANMMETGKITMDENGKLKTTIFARLKSVASSVPSINDFASHQNSFMNVTDPTPLLPSTNASFDFLAKEKNNIEQKNVKQKLSAPVECTKVINVQPCNTNAPIRLSDHDTQINSIASKLENSLAPLKSPIIQSAKKSNGIKVYPIRGSTSANNTIAIQKIVAQTTKSHTNQSNAFDAKKSSQTKVVSKKAKLMQIIDETNPRFTRSGKAIKSQLLDSLDPVDKPLSKKRSLSLSNIDDAHNPLDSLLEAARMIKNEVTAEMPNRVKARVSDDTDRLVNDTENKINENGVETEIKIRQAVAKLANDGVLQASECGSTIDKCSIVDDRSIVINKKVDEDVESPANMAASAMLELLGLNAKKGS